MINIQMVLCYNNEWFDAVLAQHGSHCAYAVGSSSTSIRTGGRGGRG